MPLAGLVRDLTRGDLEGGEQAERAVALVVVGVPLDLARPELEHRLRSIERLDLGLLVDRQDDRTRGRGEIEPDDVGDLGDKLGVAAELERLAPMRLEPAFGPHPAHGRGAHGRWNVAETEGHLRGHVRLDHERPERQGRVAKAGGAPADDLIGGQAACRHRVEGRRRHTLHEIRG